MRPSHLWPQLLPHHHASRRGGTGPASVEPSLRPVLGAPPQVSTPMVLGAVYRARHEPPSIPLPVSGTLPPPAPWAAFLLGSSRSRTSAPSPTAPRLDPLRGLPPPGAPRGQLATRGKSLPGTWGGRRRGGVGDSEAGRERLATRRFSSGGHRLALQPGCRLHQAVPAAPGHPPRLHSGWGLRAPRGWQKG